MSFTKLLFVSLFAIFRANTFVLAVHRGRPVYDIRQVPYMASLHYDNKYICGGSIISNSWILTAAHCVAQSIMLQPTNQKKMVDRNIKFLSVRTGTSRFNDNSALFEVEKVIRRPAVDKYYPDIALIKLKNPIHFNEYQKNIPIACSEQGQPKVGDNVTLSGFGINENKKHPEYLQQMDVTITNVNDGDSFDTYDFNMSYHADSGDSGSPVVYNGVLVGIAQRTYPGKYGADHHTMVNVHALWISAATRFQIEEKCPR